MYISTIIARMRAFRRYASLTTVKLQNAVFIDIWKIAFAYDLYIFLAKV